MNRGRDRLVGRAHCVAHIEFTHVDSLCEHRYTVLMTDPGVLGTFSRKNAWCVRMGDAGDTVARR